jgi:hydroxymethylglutaryl-CoA lyase
MANSADVLNYILGHPPAAPQSVNYNFLVPNLKGLQMFLKTSEEAQRSADTLPPTPPASPQSTVDEPAPITSAENPNETASSSTARQSSKKDLSPPFTTEVSIFAAATEAFSKANINCTIAESLERFKPIIALAKEKNVRVRGYVSVALGCPYEGPDVDPVKVAEVTRSLLEMGADEVSVADTTGMGTAPRTEKLLKALTAAGIANQDLALHFHDTYGQALVNTVVGLEHGIRTFDSSVGGLGGCPYSKGATGNVATEDLVYCLHSLGVQTGVDVQMMAEIGDWISKELGRANDSRAGKAVLARLKS